MRLPALAERDDLAGYAEKVAGDVVSVQGRGTYARDIWNRYPDLPPSLRGGWPVAVEIVETSRRPRQGRGRT